MFFDRLTGVGVLALIPERWARVNMGKAVGRCVWLQQDIDTAIVAAAMRGLTVVRLKSGDPSVFGRAAEKIAAAQSHGVAVEVTPGATAASAVAASALRPLTERGRFDRVLMLSATTLTGALPQDVARAIAPGTRVAVYMGIHLARQLQHRLIAAGLCPDTSVLIVQDTSSIAERQ